MRPSDSILECLALRFHIDELFFINTCFAILRSLFPFWTANLAQSVIYTAVLYDMAFTGWGPLFVFTLAITQGLMFERSRILIYVLAVHLIVISCSRKLWKPTTPIFRSGGIHKPSM